MKKLVEKIVECSVKTTNRFELSLNIAREFEAKIIAEIGVWKGEYAEYMLRHNPKIDQYFMIDPWQNLSDWNKPFNVENEEFNEIFVEAMTRTEFAKNKRVVLRAVTKDAVHQIEDGSLDMVYIDGDHTLRGVSIDLMLIYEKVKEGGLIVGDDFTKTPWQHSNKYEPTLINPFAAYFAEAKNDPIIIFENNQYVIPKSNGLKYSYTDTTGEYGPLSLRTL